jgi:hypothetical protein
MTEPGPIARASLAIDTRVFDQCALAAPVDAPADDPAAVAQTARRKSFGYRMGMDYLLVAHDPTLITLAAYGE